MEKGNKIVLVLGILAIVAGVLVFSEASSFQKNAVLTEGKVVHVIGTSYKIKYFTTDGAENIYQGSRKIHGFHEGDVVKIWYKPDNPSRARLNNGKDVARTILIVGIVCILLGIYPLFQRKKSNAAS
jgi:uncharacterized membrane protein HdeD (DUF308 family)